MPKKTHLHPTDYALAVREFGEPAIAGLARRPTTLSTWKRRGVPADVILPLVIAKYGLHRLTEYPSKLVASEGGQLIAPPPEGLTPEVWNQIKPLLIPLRDILKSMDIDGHEERWDLIVGNIHTFAELVRRDIDPGFQEQKKPPGRRKKVG
jgi:hypothetical protein